MQSAAEGRVFPAAAVCAGARRVDNKPAVRPVDALSHTLQRLERTPDLNPEELEEARALAREIFGWLEEGGPARVEQQLLERAEAISSAYGDALDQARRLLQE